MSFSLTSQAQTVYDQASRSYDLRVGGLLMPDTIKPSDATLTQIYDRLNVLTNVAHMLIEITCQLRKGLTGEEPDSSPSLQVPADGLVNSLHAQVGLLEEQLTRVAENLHALARRL